MSYKVGDKIRIKSREHFIEKYGAHRMPFGITMGKIEALGKMYPIYKRFRGDAVEVIVSNGQIGTFKIEDVEPAITLIDPRDLK